MYACCWRKQTVASEKTLSKTKTCPYTLNRSDIKTTLTHNKINYIRQYEHLSVIIYLWCCFRCNIVTYAFDRKKKMSGSARILQGYECLRFRQVKPISLFIPLDIKTKHVYFQYRLLHSVFWIYLKQ